MTTRTYNPQMQRSNYPLPKWPQYSNQIRGVEGALRRIQADLLKIEELCYQYEVCSLKLPHTHDVEDVAKNLISTIGSRKKRKENSPTYVPKRKA
jgi:hypothetical protein